MQLDQALVDAALYLARDRWRAGEGGAAAMYTETGRILTSVGTDCPNECARLCHETGAICEAHKLGERVTASVCVHLNRAGAEFIVLPPCGVCVERLAYWGRDVQVAVPSAEVEAGWTAKRLSEVQPYFWFSAWSDETRS